MTFSSEGFNLFYHWNDSIQITEGIYTTLSVKWEANMLP